MAKRYRLTNNSDETDIAALISGDTIFAIPYFQRAYKWKPQRIRQLTKDILDVIDSDGFHFLGAIIVHGRRSNPSDPDVFDVIDGQQRLTTLMICLCAVVKLLSLHKRHDEAAGLFLKYLVVGRATKLPSNLKLHPCKEDRAQLNAVYRELLADTKLQTALGGFKPKYLPAGSQETGQLRRNYRFVLRFLKEQERHEGLARIRAIYGAILKAMSVVQIDVWDPTNGPKIFDSLNSRQEPMTIGDLVRNEIFSKVAGEELDVLENIDETEWQPFYRRFHHNGKNRFDAYFFPYGLIQDPNVKKGEVYATLREKWEKIHQPSEIIAQLRTYQDAFLDLEYGTNNCGLSTGTAPVFRQFYEMNAPSSVYPFLMQLAHAAAGGQVSDQDTRSTLAVVESFLVRRAVCGHEPTGLHAVFKRLWADCKEAPTGCLVESLIRRHRTVVWPTNDDFGRAIGTRSLDETRIVRYLILSLDRALEGDCPSDVPWIEHVWPKRPSKDWKGIFVEREHRQLRTRLANLIPLSEELNIHLGNRGYQEKRKSYADDSMFKTAREFAERYENWTPQALERRGEELGKIALARWAH